MVCVILFASVNSFNLATSIMAQSKYWGEHSYNLFSALKGDHDIRPYAVSSRRIDHRRRWVQERNLPCMDWEFDQNWCRTDLSRRTSLDWLTKGQTRTPGIDDISAFSKITVGQFCQLWNPFSYSIARLDDLWCSCWLTEFPRNGSS